MSARILASVFLLFFPLITLASSCDLPGATVVYVNGVLTSYADAKKDLGRLQTEYIRKTGDYSTNFITGYNESHLNGAGDLLQSLAQAFNLSVSNYDLDTILMQIHPQVTTRKILLVGHSQGTFYTNEMYGYLTQHGVSKESIAVYNLATPASYVAGGGQYITSTNDKVINDIRDKEIRGNRDVYLNSYYTVGDVVASALRANVTLPKEDGWDADPHGGHYLSKSYLDGASSQIMRDINGELGRLKATDATDSPDGCFTPPTGGIAYKAQKALFAVADPAAGGIGSVKNGVVALAHNTSGVLASGFRALGTALSNLLDSRPSTLGQASAVALAVEGSVAEDTVPTEESIAPETFAQSPEPATETVVPQPDAPPAIPESSEPQQAAPEQPAPPVAPLIPTQPLLGIAAGFGGGGGSSNTSTDNSSQNNSSNQNNSSSQSQNQSQPVVVPLSIASLADNATIATTSATFSGTTSAGFIVMALRGTSAATTSADASGNWSIDVVLPEGASQVEFAADDGAGNTSATTTRNVTVDTVAPSAPTASVGECTASLASGFCLVASTTVSVSWSTVPAAAQYALFRDSTLQATTTAGAITGTTTDNATSTFEVVAYDAAGNAATSSPVDVRTATRPLIINEIGFGTSTPLAAQQFIELKNLSSFTLDLSHVSIARSSGSPIQLSGTIGPVSTGVVDGFLVVEQTDFSGFGVNKLNVSFDDLSTAGEQLSLVWDGNASTTLDATPAVATCGGWCKGAANAQLGTSVQLLTFSTPLSMERSSDSSDGTLAASWHSTDSYGPYFGNNEGTWGTPGIANSADLPESGVVCGPQKSLVIANQPNNPTGDCYFLSRFISSGATRYGFLYKGDVGSAVQEAASLLGGAIAKSVTITMPLGSVAGDYFFFAVAEIRTSFVYNDVTDFNNYFTGVSLTPPHGNYSVVRWTYSP